MPSKIREFLNKDGPSFIQFMPWKTKDLNSVIATSRINSALKDLDEVSKFGALFKLYSLWIRVAYFDDMASYNDAWEVFGHNFAKVHNQEVTLRIGLGPDDDTSVLKLTYLRQLPDESVVEETLFQFVGPTVQADVHLKMLRELIPGTKTGAANVKI